MDAITKLVSEKTGVPEEVAAKVVEVMVDLLKDKLPAPFDSQIEGILTGDVDAAGLLGDMAGGGGSSGLMGMFSSLLGGRKK